MHDIFLGMQKCIIRKLLLISDHQKTKEKKIQMMSSPVSNSAKTKGQQGVRNGHTLEGTLTADWFPRSSDTVSGKQTTVRISRAEQLPANQTLVHRNHESSSHRYNEKARNHEGAKRTFFFD